MAENLTPKKYIDDSNMKQILTAVKNEIHSDDSIITTESQFLALPEEQRLNNSYYLYDIGVHYKNGVAYSRKKPIQLTMEEYKALVEVDPDQEYIVSANSEGILLEASDIGYSNAVSNLPCTTVQGAIDKIAEKVDGIDRYSTDEVKTNKVWIDGKPIYRKTVEFSTSTLSAGENYIPHGLQNIELLMVNKNWSFLVNENNNHKVTTWQFGNSVNTNATTISDYSCNIVWVDASTISIYIGSMLNPKKVIITFEYTKTTD